MKKFSPKKSIFVLCMVISGSSFAGDNVGIYSAEYRNEGAKKSSSMLDDGLHFMADQPSLSLNDFNYKVLEDKRGVEIYLNPKEIKALNKVVSQFPDKRLAVIFSGQIIMSSKLTSPISDQGLYLSFDQDSDFANFKKLLTK